jgi:uncharacterized protein YuzB (UPF0349 family)
MKELSNNCIKKPFDNDNENYYHCNEKDFHIPRRGRYGLMKKIKYCCKNLKNGSKKVYKSLKNEFPEIKQKKKDCLGSCKLCSKQCFVLIGKSEVIVAPSADVLYKKLKRRIG